MNNKLKTIFALIIVFFLLFTSIMFFQNVQAFDPEEVIVELPDAENLSVNGANLAVMANGKIIDAFLKYTYLGGGDEQTRSVSSYYKVSSDNGSTWEPDNATLLIAGEYNVWGAFVGGFTLCTNGRLLCPYLKWYNRYNSKVYLLYSDDNATTWVDYGSSLPQNGTHTGCLGNGILLSDGYTVIMPHSYDYGSGGWQVEFFITTDNGSSWTNSQIPNGDLTDVLEATLVELSNGTLYALCRTPDSYFAKSWSEDKGQTWTPATLSDLKCPGAPGDLYRWSWTPNRILFIRDNSTANRWPLDIAISYDDCQTWTYNKTIKDEGYGVAYPKVVRTENDRVLTGWWDYENHPNCDTRTAWFPLSWLTGEEIQFISINGGTNGTIIFDSTPTFNWTVVEDTSQYWLQISTDPDFAEPTEINITDINEENYPDNCNINATRVSFTLTTPLSTYGKYYCRVRAYILI